MKKIAVVLILLISSIAVKAQGNSLVFNQVLTFSDKNITVNPYTIATVPADRVWKIEFMAGYRYNNNNSFSIVSNGMDNDPYIFSQLSSSNPLVQMPSGPVWMKAGDAIRIHYGTSSYPASFFISVIEFVVVPNP